MCSETEGEAPAAGGAAELGAAQVAHDLDDLIMEDDESLDGDVPFEGIV